MTVITDPHDKELELPIPDELLFNIDESKELIFALLDSLHNMFEKTTDEGSVLTLAINWTNKIMKNIGGRIYIL